MLTPIHIKQAVVLAAVGFIVGSAFRLSRLFAGAAAVSGTLYLGFFVQRRGLGRLVGWGLEALDMLRAHPIMTGGFVLGLMLSATWSQSNSRD